MLCLELVCSISQDTFLHGAFVPPQDSIYDEMEDRWSKKKADWEREEKLEREKILLQQSEYRNFYLLDGPCTQKPAIKFGLNLRKAASDPLRVTATWLCIEFSRK